jgi:hypothetical protein
LFALTSFFFRLEARLLTLQLLHFLDFYLFSGLSHLVTSLGDILCLMATSSDLLEGPLEEVGYGFETLGPRIDHFGAHRFSKS